MVARLWLRTASAALACFLLAATGCVGPMACGPNGSCGPIGLASCDGCGECEGCGELYIDPWINEPADCCDPCDQCGNYNGQSCGKCRSTFGGFASIWGYRCDAPPPPCTRCGIASCGGCDGGCGDSCDGCDSCGVVTSLPPSTDGIVIRESVIGHPTTADVVEIRPAEAPYHPHRQRKIFRTREEIAVGPPNASDY